MPPVNLFRNLELAKRSKIEIALSDHEIAASKRAPVSMRAMPRPITKKATLIPKDSG